MSKDTTQTNLFSHEGRQQLLTDLSRVDKSVMNWAPKRGARTIHGHLLHIAALEYALATAVYPSGTDHSLWQHLRAGFAREFGEKFEPTGKDPLELLKASRAILEKACDSAKATSFEKLEFKSVGKSFGLSEKMLESFVDTMAHKALGYSGSIDIRLTVASHENFHRGQITLICWLYS